MARGLGENTASGLRNTRSPLSACPFCDNADPVKVIMPAIGGSKEQVMCSQCKTLRPNQKEIVCEPTGIDYLDRFQKMYGPWQKEYEMGSLMGLYYMRDTFVNKYAWAIPNEDALQTISDLGPVVEIGAGTGYWASLLQTRGVDVRAYDKSAVDADKNHYHKDTQTWTDVQRGGPKILSRTPLRYNLFLSWPPYLDEKEKGSFDFGVTCLEHFRGEHVIYIGEGMGGCTGSDDFHEKLDHEYTLEKRVHIPQWPGLHDEMKVYKRR